jgi:hypothetical protein
MKAQGNIAPCRDPWPAKVNGFPSHLQTVTSQAGVRAACTQEFVAPGRSISTDHVDPWASIVKRSSQVVEKAEKAGIKMPHISPAMITQIVIELLETLHGWNDHPAGNHIEALVSVGVAAPVFGGRPDGRLRTR